MEIKSLLVVELSLLCSLILSLNGCNHYASLDEISLGMMEEHVREISKMQLVGESTNTKQYRCWMKYDKSSGPVPYVLTFIRHTYTEEEIQGAIEHNDITDPNVTEYLFSLCGRDAYWLTKVAVDEACLARLAAEKQAKAAAFGAIMQMQQNIQPDSYMAYPTGGGAYIIQGQ